MLNSKTSIPKYILVKLQKVKERERILILKSENEKKTNQKKLIIYEGSLIRQIADCTRNNEGQKPMNWYMQSCQPGILYQILDTKCLIIEIKLTLIKARLI